MEVEGKGEGEGPVSHVDFKKSQCPMSHVTSLILQCHMSILRNAIYSVSYFNSLVTRLYVTC